MKKSKTAVFILSLLAGACCFTGAKLSVAESVAEGVALESKVDAFTLTDDSYTAQESFVYTATANFQSGQAAGLVFGGAAEEHYWVFNVDRYENKVKLLYFSVEEGITSATELNTDWFIGNDKMTESEKNLVSPKVATLGSVQLKVIVSAEEDGVHAEFYADNIKRFGVDNDIVLDDFAQVDENIIYEGGELGYNCFNASVTFDEAYVGETDYSYYTETYRQQYHFSQYAHWNNDPNGLVYYDGWYHMYYQHHPYSNYWSDMYWGHARSKDLVHWELLPICLFPDEDWGTGVGYMWSGSAMVYESDMSADIDALNWFPEGKGTGLLAFYTRDGGMQDQVIMSSDDGGMTWTKRRLISQEILTGVGSAKTDCRDPKVFPVLEENGKVTLWGMVVTGMATGDIWFLKSTNLLDWSAAGGFKGFRVDVNNNFRAECPDVATLQADDGTSHTVLTLTGREYLVGDIVYEEGNLKFIDLNGNDVSQLALEEIPYQRMDFGPDSYATQTFYINDTDSKYNGKTVSLSWFSGVPGHTASIESGSLAALRKVWNGGGMTIPVEWGLVAKGNGYALSQTPIVKDSTAFDKTQAYTGESLTVEGGQSLTALQSVSGNRLEIAASVYNPNGLDIAFHVGVGDDEYTAIGWTAEDGYYVDRSHTSNGGLGMGNYHVKYSSGAIENDNDTQTFYILLDEGGLEVFCEDFTVPFYVLTFISPYSTGVDFKAEGEGSVTLQTLEINQIGSIWRESSTNATETVLRVDKEEVTLDLTLSTAEELVAYSTAGGEIEWSVESGESVVRLEETSKGVRVVAISSGVATVKATCGNASKTVQVTVLGGSMEFDLTFDADGIVSGKWNMTSNGLIGTQASGDGFILANESGDDFHYTAKFDLGEGVAAAVVFRAAQDMSTYYIANYDNNSRIVKLWSHGGELARTSVSPADLSAIVISVKAVGNRIIVYFNGATVIDVTDDAVGAPTEGRFGLNVCATSAKFSAVSLFVSEYTYSGGSLTVKGDVEQHIDAIYNRTLGNAKIPAAYYKTSGRTVTLAKEYFQTLTNVGTYVLSLEGVYSAYEITVAVETLPTVEIPNVRVTVGTNVIVFIGNLKPTEVTVNDETISEDQYDIRNHTLTIYASALTEGKNTVRLSETQSFTATVEPIVSTTIAPEQNNTGYVLWIVVGAVGIILVAGAITAIILVRKKKYGNND